MDERDPPLPRSVEFLNGLARALDRLATALEKNDTYYMFEVRELGTGPLRSAYLDYGRHHHLLDDSPWSFRTKGGSADAEFGLVETIGDSRPLSWTVVSTNFVRNQSVDSMSSARPRPKAN